MAETTNGRTSEAEKMLYIITQKKVFKQQSGILLFRDKKRPANLKNLKIQEQLGYGGYGYVRRALYKEQVMAVKIMSVHLESSTDKKYRNLKDTEFSLKTNNCPDIVFCYGLFYDTKKKVIHLCMEFMDFCLHDLVFTSTRSRKVPEKVIGQITTSLVRALHDLKTKHDAIHRDIKLANILINRNGVTKLCDFGLSQQLVNSNVYSQKGDPPHIPPERLLSPGEPYDVRSDVWALGLTVFEMAEARMPFEGGTAGLEMIKNGPAPRLGENSGFSEDFRNFIASCLQKEPIDRPKYDALLSHPFILINQQGNSNTREWVTKIFNN